MPSNDAASRQVFEAIEQGDAGRLAELLAKGADPDVLQVSWPWWRPLHAIIEAIDGGACSLELLRLLLDHGARVDAWDGARDATPLLMAVFRQQLPSACLLLSRGADPNVVGAEGDTPLRWAAAEGDLEMARLLLAHGAAATIDLAGGGEGCTPLGAAARRGLVDMVELLLLSGSDREAVDVDGRTALDCAALGLSEHNSADFAERMAIVRARLSDSPSSG